MQETHIRVWTVLKKGKKRRIEAVKIVKERSEQSKNSKMDYMRDSMRNWLNSAPPGQYDSVVEEENSAQQSIGRM